MNPYLEQDDVWEDFHHNFLTWSQQALNSQLGPEYLARIETRIYIRELSDNDLLRKAPTAPLGGRRGLVATVHPDFGWLVRRAPSTGIQWWECPPYARSPARHGVPGLRCGRQIKISPLPGTEASPE